jgi:NAD(P)-dependent dehydrogenase (short-subunit alcohol dehydrogenase family)
MTLTLRIEALKRGKRPMDLQLDGKRALVTGSTVGIGFAIAKALAEEGAQVIVNGRTEERVSEAKRRIATEIPNSKIAGVAADLASPDGVTRIIEACPEIDILVNNVGIFEPRAFEQISDADWFRFFEVNVMSGVRLSRHYLPQMKDRNWGRIVFISSESAANIPAEMIHYGVTKTAQVALARGIAETTTGTGVTVNSVLPGPTLSEGVGTFLQQLAEERGLAPDEMEKQFFETARPSSLIKRFIQPEEVASLVAYVCSPLSAATNGAALRVDGGVVRSIF